MVRYNKKAKKKKQCAEPDKKVRLKLEGTEPEGEVLQNISSCVGLAVRILPSYLAIPFLMQNLELKFDVRTESCTTASRNSGYVA